MFGSVVFAEAAACLSEARVRLRAHRDRFRE